MKTLSRFVSLLLFAATTASAQTPPPVTPMTPDVIEKYEQTLPSADFIRRDAMVPMRDGTKLYTVIVMKKGTANAPILLSRTPYDAHKATHRVASQRIVDILEVMDAEFVEDGYIRVYQDIRGLHRSEGAWVLNRPLAGPLNDTGIDESTDAYDTIDWLVKNTPESNGKVGVIGSSYLGFTTLMAEINPHPALKAAVPQSPMVDGWMGDDWFHNGAFRVSSLELPGGPGHQQGERRRRFRARRGRRLHALPGSRLRGGFREDAGHREISRRPQVPREPGLHRVLVAAGGRQMARGAAADSADAARSGAVGPGRQLRRARGLSRAGAEGQEQRHGRRCTSGRGGTRAPITMVTTSAR